MEALTIQYDEKRQFERINLEAKVSIKTSDSDPVVLGWIQNISRGGFKLKTDNSLILNMLLDQGEEILFEAYEDFFKLKGKGMIQWTSDNKEEAGVKFDELDNKSRESLEDFLGMF